MQIILKRVVDNVLMNNSPSNIFKILLLIEGYHHISQVVLATSGMKGLSNVTWLKNVNILNPYAACG